LAIISRPAGNPGRPREAFRGFYFNTGKKAKAKGKGQKSKIKNIFAFYLLTFAF
jgi:hypothetical protein